MTGSRVSPTLVVTKTEDVVIPPENSRILAGRIPGVRLVQIPGAGHGLMYQSSDEFTREIIEFLQAGQQR